MRPAVITVIHNGTPRTSLISEPISNSKPEKCRLLIAGRICPEKGIHVAIAALAELRKSEQVEVSLDIVGPALPAYLHSLRENISKLDLLRNVTIHAPLSHTKMLHLYDRYDVLLFTSVTEEGFGLTIVEAMARGCLVVAVNRGGPVDIVTDGVNGLLVPPGDPSRLAEAIRLLIRTPEFAKSLRRKAIVTVKQSFVLEDKVFQLEQKLLESYRSGKRIV
jgi:Glycosyltransferase